MARLSSLHQAGVILGLLVAFALRLTALDKFGLWDGDVNTVFLAAHPLVEFQTALRETLFTVIAPLWPALTHLLFGMQPALWILRFPAVWAGTASIAVASVLARQVLPRGWVLVSIWLMAISPLLLRWSQAIRMYAGFVLFSLLSVYFVLRMLKARSRLDWLGFGLCTLLNLYTHHLAAFPLAAEAGLVGLVVAWSFLAPALARRQKLRVFSSGESSIPNPWLIIRRTLLAAGVVTAGYLPWFLTTTSLSIHSMQERVGVGIYAEEHGGRLDLDLHFLYQLFEEVIGGTGWLAWVFLAFGLAGLAYLLARKQFHQACLIVLSLVVPLAAVAIMAPPRFHAKYMAYTEPLLVILVTAGMVAVSSWIRQLAPGRRLGSVMATGVVAGSLALISVPNLWMDYSYYNGDAQIYEQNSTEPDIWHYRGPWPLFAQHIQRSQGAFLFASMPSPSCRDWQCRQIGADTYIMPDASAPLLSADWAKVGEMDIWRIAQSGSDPAAIQGAAGVPLGQKIVDGPNQQLWQAHLRVVSAQEILANGGFEQKLLGWQTDPPTSKEYKIVGDPTADGNYALMSLNDAAAELRSRPIPVEPGTLLHASMKVLNLTLTYHQTSPRIALYFENGNHKAVRYSLITPYSLPYMANEAGGAAGWQQIVTQAVVPQNARYVRFSIVTEATGLNRGRPFLVDDAHLMAIQWEPAP